MARLPPHKLKGRLALDYRAVMRLSAPTLGRVRAFASGEDAARGRDMAPELGESGAAAAYLVEYRFPILIGPDKHTDSALAFFDLNAGNNFPFSAPRVQIVSRPVPWSQHVHPASGLFCIGDGWGESRGQMLLCQLVIHVMRLLNFDEPDDGGFDGYHHEPILHWRSVLGSRPAQPGLLLPVLPADLMFGVEDADATFAPSSGFRCAPGATPLRDATDDTCSFSPARSRA